MDSWQFKQTSQKCPRYAMNLTRKSPETCSRICTTKDPWNKQIFNIRHFQRCKLGITLQRLPPSHTCLQLKVSNVKLLFIGVWLNVVDRGPWVEVVGRGCVWIKVVGIKKMPPKVEELEDCFLSF